MINKHLIGILTLSLLLFSFPVSATDYTIINDKVYIDDSHIYLSAQPHTLQESGYVYYNLTSKHFTGDIDICFGFNTTQCKPTIAEIWLGGNWIDVSDHFTSINYNYDNLNKWYYVTDLPVTAMHDYTLRVYQKINEISTGGKYGVAVKPSLETISQAISNGHFYYLDPWFDGGYDYRREITLTGGASGAQTDYQMKYTVTHDSDMKSDFSDLRFTKADGTTILDAWMESYIASTSAVVYVETDTPANGVDGDIFVYYGNSSASSAWSDANTFPAFFDGYEDALAGDWTTLAGTVDYNNAEQKYTDSQSMKLGPNGSASQTHATYLHSTNVLDFRFFIKDSGDMVAFQHGNGVKQIYTQWENSRGFGYYDTGWHWTGAISEGVWQHIEFRNINWTAYTYDVWLNGASIVTGCAMYTNAGNDDYLFLYTSPNDEVYIDNAMSRKYAANPPTYVFGSEESPPLNISVTLTPDPFTTNTIGCANFSFLVEHIETLNLSSLAVLVGINDTTANDYDNHFCMPTNSIAQLFLTHGNVLRNLNRNMSLSWENNVTITEDDISKWGGFDNDSYQVTTNVVNATHTYINVTECSLLLHPSMYYLDPYKQINAPKIQVNIDRSQSIITKMWDNEVMHGRDQNFIISMFFDSYIDSSAIPNDDLKIWYCNSSYDPSIDEFQTCEFCAELKTYTVADWENKVCTLSENASYISLSVNASDYTDPLPNNMNYVCFSSNTVSSKPYYINMTNTDPGICNRTFAQTNTAWLQNELSSLVTPYAYTPNNFYLFNRANQILEYHLYVADTTGKWLHSDIFQKEIVVGEYDPTTPVFNNFYIYCPRHDFRVSDPFMDATYDTHMFINITKGHDPDGGTVTHNLSLYYSNKTFIANINNSFPAGSVAVINFTCSDYYSGNDSYTFMCNVTDDEGNTSERWLGRNFTLGPDGSQGAVYNGHISFWGYYDLPSLYTGIDNVSLMSYNAGDDIYTIHYPFFKSKLNDTFLINHTLHLKSLNTEDVAYLRYRGILNIEDTNIHAWNTNTDVVAPTTDLYRAYIKSLFAAHTHISNSELSNLGYDEFRREGLNYVQSVLVNITRSTLSYNSRGVIFEYTDDTVKISDCIINNNVETGVGVYFVNNTLIHNNTFTNNGRTSLRLYRAHNNILINNTLLNSGDYGTKLEYSSNNTYRNNSILNTNLIDVYLGYTSLNNHYIDSKDDIDLRTSSTSSLTVENSNNQAFSDTSDSTTTYAYPSNFSMLMDNVTINTVITNYDMHITPNSNRLEINGINWDGAYYYPIIVNTTSPVNITSVWFNITNPNWIQTINDNNITIYRDSIEYSTIHNADDSGTLNYEYGAGYSSHEFEFKLTFTDEDLSTFAGVKRVFASTYAALDTFIDNIMRIIPLLIGGMAILFVISIAGLVIGTLKRW
jgi:parallel beta-helix repeat protein